MNKTKSIFSALFFLILINTALILMLDFAAGSIYTRLVDKPPSTESQKHNILGFKEVPNLEGTFVWPEHPLGKFKSYTNSESLPTNQEYKLEKPENSNRIIVMGDSHTAGAMSPDETYPSRLQVHLELNEKNKFEVINGGHGRYSPYQSFLMLKHDLLKYNPDKVIVAIYVGNDFADLLRFDDRPSLSLVENNVVEREAEYIIYDDPPLPIWSSNSIIYALYQQHFKFYKDRIQYLIELNKALGGSFTDSLGLVYTFFKIKNQEIISQTLAQTIFFDRHPDAQKDSITLMRSIVDMHNQLAKDNNYEVSYLILPSKVQIEAHLDNERLTRAYELASINNGVGETDEELANELRLYLENNSLSFIDPRDALRARAKENQAVYWNQDYHINTIGTDIVASLIAKHLSTK